MVTMVEDFIQKWDLNEDAKDALFSLPDDVQDAVMADFDPRKGTRNTSDLFCGFVKSRMHPPPRGKVIRPSKASSKREEENHFSSSGTKEEREALEYAEGDLGNLIQESHGLIEKYDLSAENQGLLAACPMDVQEKICLDFKPKDKTKDVNSLFKSFCVSRLETRIEILPVHLQEILSTDPALQDFFVKHELGPEPQRRMLSLPDYVRESIMQDFSPRDLTKDRTALFLSFLRSREATVARKGEGAGLGANPSSPPPVRTSTTEPPRRRSVIEVSDDQIIEFAEKWNIGDEARNFLRDLPQEVLPVVIEDFAPREGARDIDNLLQAFAKSCMRSRNIAYHEDEHLSRPVRTPLARHPEPQGRRSRTNGGVANVQIRDFADKWCLSDESQNFLLELPREVLHAVMEDFAPREGARDIDNLLQAFAKSYMRVRNANPSSSRPVRISADPGPAQHHAPANEEVLDDQIFDFANKWNISEESQMFLRDLPREVLVSVIEDFSPREGARDIDNMLQAFAKSRYNGPKGPRGTHRGRSEKSPRGRRERSRSARRSSRTRTSIRRTIVTSARRSEGSMRGAAPVSSSQAPAPRRGGQSGGSGSMTTKDFIRLHRLDPGSIEMLNALRNHERVLEKIIQEFNPRDPSADANSTFASFWKSRTVTGIADSFGLDREASRLYQELDTETQVRVCAEFSPRDEVKDMNSLFTKFVRSRMDKSRDRDRGSRGRKRQRDEISSFIAEWKLSEDSEEALRNLSRENQAVVMNKFAPRSDTRHPDNLFKKFVASFA